MKWAIDIDGTIDTNPPFFAQLTYSLKKSKTHSVYILTARNPIRKQETIDYLFRNNIFYKELIMMNHQHKRDHKSLLLWKIDQINSFNIDIWIENELKLYQQLYQINLSQLIGACELIWF